MLSFNHTLWVPAHLVADAGTYLTVNPELALASAQRASDRLGGNPVIFEVRVETKTALMDEDELPGVKQKFLEIADVKLNSITASELLSKSNLNAILDDVMDAWLAYFESSRSVQEFHAAYLASLRKPLHNYLLAYLEKTVEGLGEQDPDTREREAKDALVHAIGSVARLQVNRYENLENIRVPTGIGFRGSNQIISAIEIIPAQDNASSLVPRYGTPSQQLLDDLNALLNP
jgi:hypothetical protein